MHTISLNIHTIQEIYFETHHCIVIDFYQERKLLRVVWRLRETVSLCQFLQIKKRSPPFPSSLVTSLSTLEGRKRGCAQLPLKPPSACPHSPAAQQVPSHHQTKHNSKNNRGRAETTSGIGCIHRKGPLNGVWTTPTIAF